MTEAEIFPLGRNLILELILQTNALSSELLEAQQRYLHLPKVTPKATLCQFSDGKAFPQNPFYPSFVARRASCMAHWNTSEGGPCFLRPTKASATDSPNPDKMAFPHCVKEVNSTGQCVIDEAYGRCKNVWCDSNNVEHGAGLQTVDPLITTPWHPNASDAMARHVQGWSNQFAFPWEVIFSFHLSLILLRLECSGTSLLAGSHNEQSDVQALTETSAAWKNQTGRSGSTPPPSSPRQP